MTTLTKAELELRKLELEVLKAEADAAHAEALRKIERKRKKNELRKETAEAGLAALELERALDTAEEEDRYEARRVFHFSFPVTDGSVRNCIRQLQTWAEVDPGCDMTITFNSPGGSIFDGVELGDFILRLRSEGHKVTGRVAGLAASMAGWLVQYCTDRVITPSSYLHLHEASSVAWGKSSEIADEADLVKRLTQDAARIYADRSGGKHTPESVLALMERRELYLSAEQALGHGFVDRIE